MGNNFSIQKLSAGDAQKLVDFRRTIYDEDQPTNAYTTKKNPPSIQELKPFAEDAWETNVAVVAVESNKIIGEVWCHRETGMKPEEVRISAGVGKEYRGIGLAYLLFYAITTELKNRGVEKIDSIIFDTNAPSRRFLEKIGALKDESFKRSYHDERRNTNYLESRYTMDVSDLQKTLMSKLKEYKLSAVEV